MVAPASSARWLPPQRKGLLYIQPFRGKKLTDVSYSGVAVGSSIGHAIGGFFGGGSSQPAEVASDSAVQSQAQDGSTYQSTNYGRSCETDAKAFTRCLDENKGSDYQMSICGWYLEQLVSNIPLN